MPETSSSSPRAPDTYWLTRFVILRWLGCVYAVAFFVAAKGKSLTADERG